MDSSVVNTGPPVVVCLSRDETKMGARENVVSDRPRRISLVICHHFLSSALRKIRKIFLL